MEHPVNAPLPRKPVGGIAAAALAAAAGYAGAAEEFTDYELAEGRSSYEECYAVRGGVPYVRHTLRLVFDKHCAAAWFPPEFCRRAAVEGVVARIETASGERLEVGCSERFGVEQPLRLKSFSFDTGRRPTDPPLAELLLESEDADPAKTYRLP